MNHPQMPALPALALGLLCVRPDRPERFAFYTPDGALQGSLAMDQSPADFANCNGLKLVALSTFTGELGGAAWVVFRTAGDAALAVRAAGEDAGG